MGQPTQQQKAEDLLARWWDTYTAVVIVVCFVIMFYMAAADSL